MDPFEEVFETNKGKLFAYLLRMTRNGDTASDILQESATRCLEHYGGRAITPALLFTIARNVCMDHWRRTARLTVLDEQQPDTRPDPEHDAIVKDRFQRVLDGMQALNQEERDILSMVASSELPYEQIARIQGTTVSNIKVKVHRARIKLRRYLEVSPHA
jgi:RNA polymerase sigma-70 factor (ECF subfamily)